jgi:hypothetical protein
MIFEGMVELVGSVEFFTRKYRDTEARVKRCGV